MNDREDRLCCAGAWVNVRMPVGYTRWHFALGDKADQLLSEWMVFRHPAHSRVDWPLVLELLRTRHPVLYRSLYMTHVAYLEELFEDDFSLDEDPSDGL